MDEKLLQFIWRYQLIDPARLFTTAGEQVKIFHPGVHNIDTGPDFSMAKVCIGDTVWVGHVEIHLKTSYWKKHHHDHDPKYRNVTLHVVYEHDCEIQQNIPVIELRDVINSSIIDQYRNIMYHKGWIPCERLIGAIDDFRFRNGLPALAVERLHQKAERVLQRLRINQHNWEETLYHSVAYAYGLKINADTFEKLAQSLPLTIIARHKNNLQQIEAMLFGQAGFLQPTLKDDYSRALSKEYAFLRKKYRLQPLQVHEWQFFRLRPLAFPTVRIAQFAHFLYHSVHLFSKIKELTNITDLEKLFQTGVSNYWHEHYRFDELSVRSDKRLGKTTIRLILINSIIPALFAYGQYLNDASLRERALGLLEQLPPETNAMLHKWASLRYAPKNALESQAMLELKHNYCDRKRCLHCHVGTHLLRTVSRS